MDIHPRVLDNLLDMMGLGNLNIKDRQLELNSIFYGKLLERTEGRSAMFIVAQIAEEACLLLLAS